MSAKPSDRTDVLASRISGHGPPDVERQQLLRLAEGRTDLISLARGDLDLPTPRHIIEAAQDALDHGATRYTHWQGSLELRKAIVDKYQRQHGLDLSPAEVVVTTGAQEALFITLQTLLDPGDEVILGTPHYKTYSRATRLAGGVPVAVPTSPDNGFVLRPEDVRERIGSRTKILVLVTPNNPTGAVIPAETMAEFARLVTENDLLVIMDEIYEPWVFDGHVHTSLAAFPDVRDRTIVINGFSKAYAMTGWRVGYLIAPQAIAQAMEVVKHTISICTSAPCQAGALEALTAGHDDLIEMYRVYEERRQVLLTGLAAVGLTSPGSHGGLYLYTDIGPLGRSALEFCIQMLDFGVQVFPATPFGGSDHHLRLSFLVPAGDLQEAMERLGAMVRSL